MITATTHRERRQTLARRIGCGLNLLSGHDETPKNDRGNSYPFRQDSTLLHFSGLARPDLALMLDCDSGQATLLADIDNLVPDAQRQATAMLGPGIYCNPWVAEQWRAQGLHTDLINDDAHARHMNFGGVRIEDDVLITARGARVPGPHIARTVAELEAACAG